MIETLSFAGVTYPSDGAKAYWGYHASPTTLTPPFGTEFTIYTGVANSDDSRNSVNSSGSGTTGYLLFTFPLRGRAANELVVTWEGYGKRSTSYYARLYGWHASGAWVQLASHTDSTDLTVVWRTNAVADYCAGGILSLMTLGPAYSSGFNGTIYIDFIMARLYSPEAFII